MSSNRSAGFLRRIAVLGAAVLIMTSGTVSAFADVSPEDEIEQESAVLQTEETEEAEILDAADEDKDEEAVDESEEEEIAPEIKPDAQFYSTSTGGLTVTDVSYDPDEKDVTFKFNKKVHYRTDSEGEKLVTVKIYTEDSKKNQVVSVKKYSSKKISVNSKKLKYGYKYKFSINGVRARGAKKFVTISGTFRAIK